MKTSTEKRRKQKRRHTPCMVTLGMSRFSRVNSWSRDFGRCWLVSEIFEARPTALTGSGDVGVTIDGIVAVMPAAFWTPPEFVTAPCLRIGVFVTAHSALRDRSLWGSGATEAITSEFSCAATDRPSCDKLLTLSRDRDSTASVSLQSSAASLHNYKQHTSSYHWTFSPLLKCPTVKWFCILHTRINFHLAKLLAVDVILYHTAFPRSFRDLSL